MWRLIPLGEARAGPATRRTRRVPLDVLHLCGWSLADPLTRGQVLPILGELASHGRRVALLTYEHPLFASDRDGFARATADLEAHGIQWFGVRHRSGPFLLGQLITAVQAIVVSARLRLKGRINVFHSLGNATAPAAVSAAIWRGTFLHNDHGRLSEEYADAGRWERGSLPYRLARWCEERFATRSDVITVLSEHRRRSLQRSTSVPIVVLPCGVDTDRFVFDMALRQAVRSDLGLTGTVAVYAGKLGGMYAVEQMMDFVAAAVEVIADLRLLILTPEEKEPFRDRARERRIEEITTICSSNWDDVPSYFSAADLGLSFVQPSPSIADRSPVKNAEYLSCGLPVVCTSGIGDYGVFLTEDRVGVVVDAFDADSYRRAAEELSTLLEDPDLRDRCRATAEKRVGLKQVIIPGYLRIYEALLGGSDAGEKFGGTPSKVATT